MACLLGWPRGKRLANCPTPTRASLFPHFQRRHSYSSLFRHRGLPWKKQTFLPWKKALLVKGCELFVSCPHGVVTHKETFSTALHAPPLPNT